MAKKTLVRDRAETRARILGAVGTLLAGEGFRGIGVNAVAQRAAADKVLIYRYFGGLPGLLEAYAEEGDFWWRVDELIGGRAKPSRDTPSSWVRFAFERHVAWLRAHELTLEILAWETIETNPLTDSLAAVRERRGRELIAIIGDRFMLPKDVDVQALSTVLGAAGNYLAIRARGNRYYDGIDLWHNAGWERLCDVVEHIAASLFER